MDSLEIRQPQNFPPKSIDTERALGVDKLIIFQERTVAAQPYGA